MGFALRRADTRAWLALAAAIGCFATASTVSIGRSGLTAPAATTVIAIGGAVPAGFWARRVHRKTHALAALCLWGFVLLVGSGQAITGAAASGSVGTPLALTVLLWTGTLAAGVTTVYLGCREFRPPAYPAGTESVLDGESDWSSR